MTTPSPLTLSPASTGLVVIDIQERLVAAMPEESGAQAIARAERLVEGAKITGLPVLVTEQYPKGLGPTVPSLKEKAVGAGATFLEKVEFDASANEGIRAQLLRWRAEGRTAIVLAGMEAHICVYQTARGLSSLGFSVHVPRVPTSEHRHEVSGPNINVRASPRSEWRGVARASPRSAEVRASPRSEWRGVARASTNAPVQGHVGSS
jgi:hypothetical protein